MTRPHIQKFLETPFRSLFALWVPVLFSMVAEPLTGLVDTAFVARLGAEPLAALGVGTMVMSGGLWLFNFLSVGSQTEVSQALGRDELFEARKMGSLAVFLATGIGIVTCVLLLASASGLGSLMGASGYIHEHAVTYIQIRAFGGPAVLVTMTSFGILYGLGDMRTPLFIALGVNVLNIVLDAFFIFGVGPLPAFGIAGAAMASCISQILGALLAVYFVKNKLGFTKDIELHNVKRLLTIGRDMFFRTGSLIFFLLLATRLATKIGPEAGAAHQAIRQVWVFTALFLDATAVVAQSLIGFYYGSGDIKRARVVARYVCFWSVTIGFLLLVVMFAGSHWSAAMLVPTLSSTYFNPPWLVAALFQPIGAIAFVTDGIHWGTGDFRYLRNVVFVATSAGVLSLLYLEMMSVESLTLIWWITGVWLAIRGIGGILRIWPGFAASPLRL